MIKSRDMAFAVAVFIQGATLLASFVTNICGWEAWLPTLAAFMLSFLLVLIYSSISNKFPDMHIMQINREVCGRVWGDIISWFYVFFFLTSACFNAYNMSAFFVGYVMPETPSVAFLIMFIFICSRAVRIGMDNITKMSVLLFVIISLFIIINFGFLVPKMKIENFRPFFDHSFWEYIRGTHTELMSSFGETVVFLVFADQLSGKEFKKSLFFGLLLGGVMLLVVIIRSVAVLGVTVSISNVPSYEVLRMINIKNTFTRIETIYSFLLMTMSFFKVSVMYCAIVRAIAYLTGIKEESGIINIVGVLMVCYSSISFQSGFDGLKWGTKYSAFFSSPFVVIIPLAVLLLSMVKIKKRA